VAPYLEIKLQVIFVYRHELTDPLPVGLTSGCTIEVVDGARLSLLGEVGMIDSREMEARMARGDRCHGGFIAGRLAHYSWAQTAGWHPLTEAGRRLAVRPGDLWIYHCRTAEWARGRGLYASALRTIVSEHRRQGGERRWIYTTAENVPSQKGILRAGFALDRSLRALRLGAWYLPLP
jgi:hypothetical protein